MYKIIVFILTLLATGATAEVMALRNINIGDPCPPFCGLQADGSKICSSTFENTILAASFIRLDQKKSLKVIVALQELYTRYRDGDVSIIGIVSGDVDLQEITAFAEKNGITMPLLLDRSREVYGRFGVFVYPTTVVFDENGTLRYLFGSSTINIRRRMEGSINYLSGEIDQDALEKIMHPVVEEIDHERVRAERYYNLARKSFARGHFSRAKKIVTLSLEGYSAHALSYSLYGYILIEEEDYVSALEQFELSLKLDPELEEAKAGKQICLNKTGS